MLVANLGGSYDKQGITVMSKLIKIKGFTLIELVIVVAIVGILAAIAYPAYTEQVRKSRRADAKAVLLEAAQWMERFYSQNSRYDQMRGGGAVPFASSGLTKAPKEGGPVGGHYVVSLVAVGADSYTLQAVPQIAGGQNQDRCGTLTVANTGAKGVSSGTVAECW